MKNNSYPNIRFSREDAAILFVDHQVGLILGVHDHSQETLRNNVVALARAAKAYGLPSVLTTSADDGPNGPILPELLAELPEVPLIKRAGEIDAFDNSEFAAAVRATGRKNLIISGISTDVCVTFASLSAVTRVPCPGGSRCLRHLEQAGCRSGNHAYARCGCRFD